VNHWGCLTSFALPNKVVDTFSKMVLVGEYLALKILRGDGSIDSQDAIGQESQVFYGMKAERSDSIDRDV
jgi:hypothetical protein